MVVELFVPCFVNQFYADTAKNMVKILNRLGVDVIYNEKQTCCGQPCFNSGFWEETLAMAQKFLNDFTGEHLIVCPSASCAGFIKTHYKKLTTDPGFLAKYTKIAGSLYEFTDFVVNVLKIDNLNLNINTTITYHDSCSALREYGIKNEPRVLLKNIKGLNFIEMNESETCCGFGGTFAVKFEPISVAMVQQKIENALATNAEYIVTTEASCLMNIDGYIRKNNLNIKAIHIADLLAKGL